jgi:clan AA aspartic protease (TIGR02281 family)
MDPSANPTPSESTKSLAIRQASALLVLLIAVLVATGLRPVRAETVPLKRDHGTFVVPVVINDQMTLNFMLDSGASDVTIPADVLSTLTRTGTIATTDFLDSQVYQLADGSQTRSRRIRIRSLRVGSVELRDVIASVAPQAGTLLLGQSFLTRLQTWTMDNQRHLLVINESPSSGLSAPPTAPTQSETAAPAAQAVAAAPATIAKNSEWLQIDKFSDMTVYLDVSSIRATADSMRSAWVKNVMMPHILRGVLPSDLKKWMTYTVHRDTADCAREKLRTDAVVFHYEDGSFSWAPAAALPTAWDLVPPDTAAASELQAMCRPSTDGTNRN